MNIMLQQKADTSLETHTSFHLTYMIHAHLLTSPDRAHATCFPPQPMVSGGLHAHKTNFIFPHTHIISVLLVLYLPSPHWVTSPKTRIFSLPSSAASSTLWPVRLKAPHARSAKQHKENALKGAKLATRGHRFPFLPLSFSLALSLSYIPTLESFKHGGGTTPSKFWKLVLDNFTANPPLGMANRQHLFFFTPKTASAHKGMQLLLVFSKCSACAIK